MRISAAITLVFVLLVNVRGSAQSGAVIPQGGAGHAERASCIILKRMGPADQVTSHMYSFGIRGKQFQYVEGKLPEGFPFHGRLTDHDVRNLQGRGAEVIVLDAHYTADDLRQARDDCRGETGKTPNQADPKAAATSEVLTKAADSAATSAATTTTTVGTELNIASTPPGADIEIDGNFVGSTPSSIHLLPGDHEIAVKKSGFAVWNRKISVSSGHININAELAPQTK